MSEMETGFAGKNVFVAGGTSGINLGIAMGFAAAGASVGVLSRSRDKVDAAVEALSAAGPPAAGYTADVREFEAVGAALTKHAEVHGELDVLVSGAAGNFPSFARDLSPNGFRTVVDIDLQGSFHVLKAAYPHLRRPGASVINISAPQAQAPMAAQIHVCAAKAGVDMLTRVLAMEWGPEGIRVNSIVPGPIAETEGMRRLAPGEDALGAIRETVPLRRLGEVEDIARVAMFLCSGHAGYVTGTVIPVDGGWSLGGDRAAMLEMARRFRAGGDKGAGAGSAGG